MGLIESEGLILRTHKLAEADKIVICLTHKCGVIRSVARGARRLKSRFGASLEPFTVVHLSLFEREGRELMALRQAEIRRSYFHLAGSTQIVASLDYLSELIIEFAPPHAPEAKLLRMVKACLETISAEPDLLSEVVCYFEFWLLKLSGVLSSLDKCTNCGMNFGTGEGRVPLYVGRDGAFKCYNCRSWDGVVIHDKVIQRLHEMHVMSPSVWAKSGANCGAKTKVELSKLLKNNITKALDRVPRGQSAILNYSPQR